MIEKIHIIVAIFAALAITILSLFQDTTFYALSIRLVIVIPIFFILGLFFRLYLKKLFAPPKDEQNEETPEDAQTEGDKTEDEHPPLDIDAYDTDENYD